MSLSARTASPLGPTPFDGFCQSSFQLWIVLMFRIFCIRIKWDNNICEENIHLHAMEVLLCPWLGNPFGIPWNSAINPIPDLWTPKFLLEFYFSDCKKCSRQFWTRFLQFGILSRHWFIRFHESENVPSICQWQVASNFDTQCTNFFRVHHRQTTAHNIYLIHTNVWKPYWRIKVSASLLRYQIKQKWIMMTNIPFCFSILLQSGIQDWATPCYWFYLELSRHYPQHYQRWWW